MNCVLPYIPFTTINLTELAHYAASNDQVISVLDGGANFNDSSILQGMVTGLSTAPTGSNTVTADASIKLSNTALAGIPAIDLIDFRYRCWQKVCDDLSQVSQANLQKVGSTVLELIRSDRLRRIRG